MMMLYTDVETGLCYSIKWKGGYKTLISYNTIPVHTGIFSPKMWKDIPPKLPVANALW